MFAFVLAAVLGLCCCSSDNSTEIVLAVPRLSGPSEALVNEIVGFECDLPWYPWNQTILLQFFKKGDRSKLLGEYSVLDGGVASISLFIRRSHEGNLECVAKGQSNPSIAPTVSNAHYLRVIEPVAGVEILTVSGALEFFEGAELELCCTTSKGTNVSYSWLLDGRPLPDTAYRRQCLFIHSTSVEDGGSYTCVATNVFNRTQVFSSNGSMLIRVKELVSNPDISFEVIKEASRNYSAAITCRSARGTPPVAFSLHDDTRPVANATSEDRTATFTVPLVLGVHAGRFQCQANNGDRTAYGRWIPLEVVPVRGPVEIRYDQDIGENYAAVGLKVYCKAAAGSHPRYWWFLNKTPLRGRGGFFSVVDQPPGQSMLLLSVGRGSAGTYRCEVRDDFDNSSAVSSKELFISSEVLNRLPVKVVAAVFGSFAFMVVVVLWCCWDGVRFRRRQYATRVRQELEMSGTLPAGEDELDSSDFGEDRDVINAARDAEVDQTI